MKNEKSNNPTQIAAFDQNYVLTSIFRSISEAASITGILRQSLIKAAYGDTILVKKRYWRAVPADMMIEPDDIGQLTLFQFDSMTGEDRRIYSTSNMDRTSIMYESQYLKLNRKV